MLCLLIKRVGGKKTATATHVPQQVRTQALRLLPCQQGVVFFFHPRGIQSANANGLAQM